MPRVGTRRPGKRPWPRCKASTKEPRPGTRRLASFITSTTSRRAKCGKAPRSLRLTPPILVAGARLAAYHLGTAFPQVKKEAEKLLHSIQWEVAIGDPETGEIYMVIENGRGDGAQGRPFTEYAIVASVARDAEPESQRIQEFWRRVYARTTSSSCRPGSIAGVRLLVDSPTSFLSSFVCQFPLYLVPEYTLCEAYRRLVQGAAIADRISWQLQGAAPSYVWGHGAGSNEGLPVQDGARPPGYAVDAIGRSSSIALVGVHHRWVFARVPPPGSTTFTPGTGCTCLTTSYTNPSDRQR